MLAVLFGSNTTEKCLLFLAAQGEGYSLEISKAFEISNTQVIRTLTKLEEGDILVGKESGRTRIYSLNPQWFLAKELKALLNKALSNVPLDLQESYFMKRRSPRKKNKPL
ncbi:MAG: winged helix-turn-helix domain-containing protein [Pseudobdellovibrionaceae bacterium]